jgi:BRCT domain type II-containing protein
MVVSVGALNCLGGLKFVVTGLLESLEREQVGGWP